MDSIHIVIAEIGYKKSSIIHKYKDKHKLTHDYNILLYSLYLQNVVNHNTNTTIKLKIRIIRLEHVGTPRQQVTVYQQITTSSHSSGLWWSK